MGKYNATPDLKAAYGLNQQVSPQRTSFDARDYITNNLDSRSKSEQVLKITIKKGVIKTSEKDKADLESLIRNTRMVSNLFSL